MFFNKWPFGLGRSPKQSEDRPLIRIELPGLTIEIDRDLLKTVAVLWPWLLRGGRRSLPLIVTLWILLMNGRGATVQEALCNQPLHDVTPIAEEVDPQQEGLQN